MFMLRQSIIFRGGVQYFRIVSMPKDVRYVHRHVRPRLNTFQARKRKQELFQTVTPPETPRYSFTDWNYDAEVFALGARLGERFNDSLLREALTDVSYVNKEIKEQESLGLHSSVSPVDLKANDELAEKGYTLIQDVMEKFLRFNFPKFPSQGIVAVRDYLTSTKVLSELALRIGCKDLILTVEYPPSEVTFAKAFKAIVAALDISSQELGLQKPCADLFVLDFVAPQLCNQDVNEIWDITHPWKLLTEIREENGLDLLEPRLIREAGRNTLLSAFVVGLYDSNRVLIATGIGETVSIAHEMAARDALKVIFGTKNQKLLFDNAIQAFIAQ